MIATTVSAPVQETRPTVALFSSKAVAFLTFFLGAPTGLLLIAHNWRQQGQAARMARSVAAAVATLAALATLAGVLGQAGNLLFLSINVLSMIVLRGKAEESEYEASADGNRLAYRNAWIGVAIGLAVGVASIVLALAAAIVLRPLIFAWVFR